MCSEGRILDAVTVVEKRLKREFEQMFEKFKNKMKCKESDVLKYVLRVKVVFSGKR